MGLLVMALTVSSRREAQAPEAGPAAHEKRPRPQTAVPKGKFGGVDGTRTRDLRRDRRKTLGELINDLLRLFNKFRRHAPTRGDTKRPA
jgi:hypothetical protein